MKYYGLFENGILINVSQLPIYTEGAETKKITKADHDLFVKSQNTKVEKQQKIIELKQKLASYDYIGIKIATGRATKEEYAKEIAQMEKWADEINELEGGGNE